MKIVERIGLTCCAWLITLAGFIVLYHFLFIQTAPLPMVFESMIGSAFVVSGTKYMWRVLTAEKKMKTAVE